MKYLVDANLPFRLALFLTSKGYDVIHTDDLPFKERTTDKEIRKISVEQERVIITKDSDFLDSHLIQGIPGKLFFVSTGNITNKELFGLFENYFEAAVQLLEIYDLIELNYDQLLVHEK